MWIKEAFVILMVATLLIMLVVLGFDVQYMLNAKIRIESAALASGWAGFSAVDLETMAERNNVAILDSRDIKLDKVNAKAITEEYLKNNFFLGEDLYPSDRSFLNDKERPVSIEVEVFNQNDPGNPSEFTTIVITLKLPVKFGPGGVLELYADKVIYANYSTFLIQSQKE